jgi:hypothetical protein
MTTTQDGLQSYRQRRNLFSLGLMAESIVPVLRQNARNHKVRIYRRGEINPLSLRAIGLNVRA